MDFNIAWKQGIISTGDIELYAQRADKSEPLVFSSGVLPYTLGGNLGVTLWRPR